MNINNEYDVFIAFHNSGDEKGAFEQATSLYNFLVKNGLKCFLFSESSNSTVYKANFIKIMQSRLLIMVCNNNLPRSSNGEIDYKKNYHLYVELDTFYALTQSDNVNRSVNDAAVLYCNNSDTKKIEKSPELLHPIFNNRDSFYVLNNNEDPEDIYEEILDWAEARIDDYDDNDISNEVVAVFTGRVSDALSRNIEGINFKKVFRHAKEIKCVGISNWTFTLTDGCKKLRDGLKKGADFEMIFLDPDCESAIIRAKEENKNTKIQITDSFDMLKSELSQFIASENCRGILTTYTYNMLPRDNMIFVYTENESYAFIQNYSHSLPGSSSPCMLLRKQSNESPLFKHYEDVYRNIKSDNNTKIIDLFIGDQNDNL